MNISDVIAAHHLNLVPTHTSNILQIATIPVLLARAKFSKILQITNILVFLAGTKFSSAALSKCRTNTTTIQCSTINSLQLGSTSTTNFSTSKYPDTKFSTRVPPAGAHVY